MCHTTNTTYLVCLHKTTSTESCRTFFASLFSKCKPSSSEVFMSDFCPECREFWDRLSISEASRRARVLEYRNAEGYEGPLTPSFIPAEANGGRSHFFGFVKDDVEWRPDHGGESRAGSAGVTREGRVTPVYIHELNAKWGEDPALSKHNSHDSADSGVTTWPGAEPKIGARLGPDEFGHDSDVGSTWSRGERVVKPEEFDLDVLERGEMRNGRLKPVAPMPVSALQRPQPTLQRKERTIDDQSMYHKGGSLSLEAKGRGRDKKR